MGDNNVFLGGFREDYITHKRHPVPHVEDSKYLTSVHNDGADSENHVVPLLKIQSSFPNKPLPAIHGTRPLPSR